MVRKRMERGRGIWDGKRNRETSTRPTHLPWAASGNGAQDSDASRTDEGPENFAILIGVVNQRSAFKKNTARVLAAKDGRGTGRNGSVVSPEMSLRHVTGCGQQVFVANRGCLDVHIRLMEENHS